MNDDGKYLIGTFEKSNVSTFIFFNVIYLFKYSINNGFLENILSI